MLSTLFILVKLGMKSMVNLESVTCVLQPKKLSIPFVNRTALT